MAIRRIICRFSVETLNYTYALLLKHQVTPIAIAPNPL